MLDDGCVSEANSRFDYPAWLAFAACSRAADDSAALEAWRIAVTQSAGLRVEVLVRATTTVRPSARHLAVCLVHAVVPVVAASAAVAARPAAELAAAIPRSELHIVTMQTNARLCTGQLKAVQDCAAGDERPFDDDACCLIRRPYSTGRPGSGPIRRRRRRENEVMGRKWPTCNDHPNDPQVAYFSNPSRTVIRIPR